MKQNKTQTFMSSANDDGFTACLVKVLTFKFTRQPAAHLKRLGKPQYFKKKGWNVVEISIIFKEHEKRKTITTCTETYFLACAIL